MKGREAQKLKDSTDYYFELAISLNQERDFARSLDYFERQRELYKKRNEVLSEVSILIKIAQIKNRIGLIYESENIAVDALKLLDGLQTDSIFKAYRIPIYNHLGILYKKLENFEAAIDYYNRALNLTETPKKKVTLLNNIGNVYAKQNKFDLAVAFYSKSYEESLSFNDKFITARALDNLGFVQSKLFNTESLSNLTKALDIRKELNYQSGIITSYLHLGEYYKDRDKNNLALIFANKALGIADLSKNVEFKNGALSFYGSLSEDLRILELIKIRDSISRGNKLIDNKNANKRYNYDLMNEEVNQKELIIERQKFSSLLFKFLIAFVILLSVFIFFGIKSKHKRDTMQEIGKTEANISKRIHDELANDVFQVMTQLQNVPQANERVIDDLDQIYSKTRDISLEYSALDTKGDFIVLLQDLLLSFNSEGLNVITKGITEVSWKTVSEIKKTSIYKVLQELMINMKKHSEASIVVVAFSENRKKISISYHDNGVGCKLKKNTGLYNVENRIASINGSLNFESEVNKGFKAKITV